MIITALLSIVSLSGTQFLLTMAKGAKCIEEKTKGLKSMIRQPDHDAAARLVKSCRPYLKPCFGRLLAINGAGCVQNQSI